VLLGNLVLIEIDYHASAGAAFGRPDAQWASVSWVFGQPQIFAFAVPALGILCELVATFSKARLAGRGALMTAIGAFGLLSLGAWAQAGYYGDVYNNIVFIGMSVALVLPLLVLLGGLAAAARRGALRPSGPFVLGVVGVLVLLLGCVGAILFVINPLQLHQLNTDTPPNLASFTQLWSPTYPAAQVGLTGLVVVAAAAVGLAGLFYWGSKITGRRVGNGAAYLVALVLLVAALLYGPSFVVFGFANRSHGLDDSLSAFSTLALVGAIAAVVAIVVAGLALLQSALSNKAAADDPWGSGQTLEWLTASPPVKGNFARPPEVESAEPVYDLRGDPDTEQEVA
jgi:cytochrome c oxidase subunit 1